MHCILHLNSISEKILPVSHASPIRNSRERSQGLGNSNIFFLFFLDRMSKAQPLRPRCGHATFPGPDWRPQSWLPLGGTTATGAMPRPVFFSISNKIKSLNIKKILSHVIIIRLPVAFLEIQTRRLSYEWPLAIIVIR